jgi:outer membrane protein assembly factor BamB
MTVAGILVGLLVTGAGADWPCFRGPKQDGICTETGLLQKWPAGGPELLWKMNGIGRGYSSVSIVGRQLFTMGDLPVPGRKDAKGKPLNRQYVIAVELGTRKVTWKTEIGPPHKDGSRCTPTIDEGRAFSLGTGGDILCVATDTGKKLWSGNLEKDFGGKMMSGWRWSESPLIDGDRVLFTPGAADAVIVALDKETGALIWKAKMPKLGSKGKDGAGYSSMTISEACGIRQYVQLLGRGVIGVEAETGRFLWGYNRVANSVANITTPVVDGDYVFASTQYKTGSAGIKLARKGDGVAAKELYWLNDEQFQNHHGGLILVNGHLYGGTNKNGGPPTCIELESGKILWQEDAPARGSAAYLYADGRFIVRYDSGPVTLVEASPAGHRIVSQFKPEKPSGPAWPHPVVNDGKLYLRHNDLLMCYDVKQ